MSKSYTDRSFSENLNLKKETDYCFETDETRCYLLRFIVAYLLCWMHCRGVKYDIGVITQFLDMHERYSNIIG